MPPAPKKKTAAGAKKPAKPKSVFVALTIDCLRCLRPLPIDALRNDVRCRACLHVFDIEKLVWRGAAKSCVAGALRGNDRRTTDFDDVAVVSRTKLAPLSCERCDEELEPGDAPSIRCRCGATIPVREADTLVKAVHKNAVAVVGERERAPIEPTEPIAFRCTCGARLTTDGTTRALRCGGCKTFVDVPDGLWDAIHPVRPRPRMFLLVGGAR